MIDFIILIAGLALVLAGANFLVDGASAIAKRFGMSDFIIGMTIVGIGTSSPEMVVSFLSAIEGNADIAVGNVVGSNLFNTLVIMGITAIITPVALTSNNIKKDIPFSLLAAFIVFTLGLGTVIDGAVENIITRVHGVMLLAMFGIFMAYTIYSSSTSSGKEEQTQQQTSKAPKNIWISILMVVGGLAGLIWGGDLFVSSACAIAKSLGVSDTVIALTILATGTSLPELASSSVAAFKKNTDLALGNVLGSNISNIFLILGGSSLIHPLSMKNITMLDTSMLVISSLLLFICAFTFKKKQLDRIEGVILTVLYISFVTYLILNTV
ncbi:MAG: calcium/sodium antiporter [Bacteroidia bacterium]|nr:calcium/sodium antiporter [Bacteroidia bacterium]